MGTYTIDPHRIAGVVVMELSGQMSVEDMQGMLAAHNAAIDTMGRHDYRILCDLRGMQPLSPECTELMELAKRYSRSKPNFQGSAVLVDTAFIGLQHRRTSSSSGVLESELTTHDEAAAMAHLKRVRRSAALMLGQRPGSPQPDPVRAR